MRIMVAAVCLVVLSIGAASADSHLEGYKAEANEPMAASLSIPKASHFLETVSLKWTKQNKCGTCHTNLAHMMARSALEERNKATEKEIRDLLFAYLADYNPGSVAPEHKHDNDNMYWNRLPIVATIAMGDGEDGEKQDPRTLKRYDDIWKMQDADGSFKWPKLPLPFLEGDAYYVTTLVAMGANYLPASYLKTPAAAAGLKKLQDYLAYTRPNDLHGELVLARASLKAPVLMTPAQRSAVMGRALALQREDGGWTLASLGDWPRKDGKPNNKAQASDGYGTGFVLYTLCKGGVPLSDQAIRRGVTWLKTHQRESGRWFTASLWSDEFHNYVSTIGTAYDVMALKACESKS